MSAAYSWKPGSDILAPADQSIRSHDTGTARSSNQSVRSHDASTIRSECATQRTRSTYSGGLTVLSRPRTRVDSPSQIPPVGTYNVSSDPVLQLSLVQMLLDVT